MGSNTNHATNLLAARVNIPANKKLNMAGIKLVYLKT
jgi:hypothetical protein